VLVAPWGPSKYKGVIFIVDKVQTFTYTTDTTSAISISLARHGLTNPLDLVRPVLGPRLVLLPRFFIFRVFPDLDAAMHPHRIPLIPDIPRTTKI